MGLWVAERPAAGEATPDDASHPMPIGCAALVSYAFESLEVAELAGVTDVPNTASDRMLRRLGFVPFSEVPGPRCPMRICRLARPRSLPSPESAPQPRPGAGLAPLDSPPPPL